MCRSRILLFNKLREGVVRRSASQTGEGQGLAQLDRTKPRTAGVAGFKAPEQVLRGIQAETGFRRECGGYFVLAVSGWRWLSGEE